MEDDFKQTFIREWIEFNRMLKERYYPNTLYVDIASYIRSKFKITQEEIRKGLFILTERRFLEHTNNPLSEDPKIFETRRRERMVELGVEEATILYAVHSVFDPASFSLRNMEWSDILCETYWHFEGEYTFQDIDELLRYFLPPKETYSMRDVYNAFVGRICEM